ncbi:MAG: hypothetical protein RR614_08910, partial [Eubacterium sp.]
MSLKIKDPKRFLIACAVSFVIVLALIVFIISRIAAAVNGKSEEKKASPSVNPGVSTTEPAKNAEGQSTTDPVKSDGNVNEVISI